MGEVLNPLAFHHGRSLWLEYKQEYRTKTREIVRDSHSARGRTAGTQLTSVYKCDSQHTETRFTMDRLPPKRLDIHRHNLKTQIINKEH